MDELWDVEPSGLAGIYKEVAETGIDAIIVSDPFVIEKAAICTNLEVHLSTQQSTINYEAAEFFYNQGVTRIVLGRECSKEEIETIIDKVPVEIETFIHGAMCAGYSGRCVLSNYLTDRDANRGGCSQICRWDFDLKGDDGDRLSSGTIGVPEFGTNFVREMLEAIKFTLIVLNCLTTSIPSLRSSDFILIVYLLCK